MISGKSLHVQVFSLIGLSSDLPMFGSILIDEKGGNMSVVDPSGISSSTQNVPAAFSLLNNPLSRGGRSVKLAFQSVNLLFTHKGSRQATFESIDPLRRKVQGLVGEPTNYGLGQVAGDSVQSGFEFARHCK